jgi:cell division septation protein DedD
MKFFKFLTLIFIVLISLYFIECASTQQGERTSKTKEPGEADKDNQITQPIPDTLKKVEVKVLKDSVPEKQEVKVTKDNEKKDTAKIVIKKPEDAFAVQLGAFKEIKNVEKFEKLVKNDFPTLTIRTEYDGETQNYKVTAGQFPTKDEAYKFRSYCVDKGYKDAWVISVPK